MNRKVWTTVSGYFFLIAVNSWFLASYSDIMICRFYFEWRSRNATQTGSGTATETVAWDSLLRCNCRVDALYFFWKVWLLELIDNLDGHCVSKLSGGGKLMNIIKENRATRFSIRATPKQKWLSENSNCVGFVSKGDPHHSLASIASVVIA